MNQRLNAGKRLRYLVAIFAIVLMSLSGLGLGDIRPKTAHASTQADGLQPLQIPVTQYNATGGPYVTHGVAPSGNAVGSVDSNDWVRYDNITTTGYTNLTISAAVINPGTQIDVYLDATESGSSISGGTLIGTFSNMGTDASYSTFRSRSIQLSQLVSGTHRLYLKFHPANNTIAYGLLNYNGLQFSRDEHAIADLQKLEISAGELEPTFKRNIAAYTLVMYEDVSQVEVTAQVVDTGFATLKMNGVSHSDNTPLTVEISQAKSIVIAVTAEDGTQKDYTVTIEHRTPYQDYYIDAANGTDINTGTNGTATSPWKTLTFACNNVPENAGVTIHLRAGTYPVTSQCLLPSKTNVVGAGVSQTTITPTMTYDPQGHTGNFGPDFFAIRTTGTSGITLSNFKMEGLINATTRAHGGILAHNVSNFVLHDVEMNNFNYTAAWVAGADNAHIYNSTFTESGYTLDNNGTLGNIAVGDLTNSSIHDVKIRESKGAYGIKGAKYASDPGVDVFTNVRFYRLDIKLKQMGAWNNFASPNFPIELWNSNTQGVEIFQSRFNGTLSIPSSDAHRNQPNSVRIHHNIFIGDTPTFVTTYTYFIESSTDYMEIDHNIFHNSLYPIASFGGTVVGMNIHHNSFTNVYGVSVLNFKAVKNLRFNHNLVTINTNVRAEERGHLPLLKLEGGASDAINITHNVFADTAEFNDGKMISPSSTATVGSNLTIDHNAFHNWTPSGTNARTF